jgi:phosphate transport system substrate-binding protein
MLKKIIFPAALMTLLYSCQEPKRPDGKAVDTPTTGQITVMVDEGYRPIVETTIDVFDSIYSRAKIDAVYTSEGEAVQALIRRSAEVAIIARKLTPDEMVYFTNRGFTPKMTAIAHDALALIVHPSNRDTLFTDEQMRQMLTGQITRWNQVSSKSALGTLQVVFDHPLSGTVRFAKDSICQGTALSANAFALQSNEEVIKHVAKNKNALGIIGANWISDTDDKGVQKFLREVRLVDIAMKAGDEGYGPYQAYLATGQYPYKRTIYIVDAQARKGLGIGFASFLAGDTGQRIVLKDGLVPATAPMRLIKVTRK